MNEDIQLRSRDFIDFMILVNKRRRVFYYLALIFISVSLFFSLNSSSQYSYKTTIKVGSADIFADIYFYQQELINIAYDADNNPFPVLGKKTGDEIIESLLNDIHFYESLTEEYLNSKYRNNLLSSEKAMSLIKNSIMFTKNYQQMSYKVEIETNEESIAGFLYNNFSLNLNKFITLRFSNHLNTLRQSIITRLKSKSKFDLNLKIEEINELILRLKLKKAASQKNSSSNISSDVDSYSSEIEIKMLEDRLVSLKTTPESYSEILSNLNFVISAKIPNTNIAYYVLFNDKMTESRNINLYFSLVLSLFLSIFLYLLIVLFYDLSTQINSRLQSNS
jgi:hypothetical protein